MLQVVRQALDVFASLLLEALHSDDLRDQHVVGLTDRLSGHVRRPRKAPIRHGVQRPADDVPIPRHQPLKVLGELRRAQLKPHEKGRGRAHPWSVMHDRTWNACRAWLPALAGRKLAVLGGSLGECLFQGALAAGLTGNRQLRGPSGDATDERCGSLAARDLDRCTLTDLSEQPGAVLLR